MNEASEFLAERLVGSGGQTDEFFSSIQPAEWQREVYADGEVWRVIQVLAHLVQAEQSVMRLIEGILAGGEGVPQDFDLDAYNQRKTRQVEQMPPAELLALFRARRRLTVERVGRMTAEDLARTGRHPFLGLAEVRDMIKLLYRHPQLHQRDIRRILDSSDRMLDSTG